MPALLLALAGCHAAPGERSAAADTPGARLEQAATARGLIADPLRTDPVGVYARETDRLCIAAGGAAFRVGALVDYGDGQGCSAAGTATREGDTLRATFGNGCALTLRFEGDRIVFPADVAPGCDAACTGRASLAALDVARLSDSASEATALADPRGRRLCS